MNESRPKEKLRQQRWMRQQRQEILEILEFRTLLNILVRYAAPKAAGLPQRYIPYSMKTRPSEEREERKSTKPPRHQPLNTVAFKKPKRATQA